MSDRSAFSISLICGFGFVIVGVGVLLVGLSATKISGLIIEDSINSLNTMFMLGGFIMSLIGVALIYIARNSGGSGGYNV